MDLGVHGAVTARGLVVRHVEDAVALRIAGADLAALEALQTATPMENRADSAHLAGLFEQIYRLSKPVIAKINGHAIAGGCGLAAVCDFSIAAEEARLGFTETRIGFVPAIVMTMLVRCVGEKVAFELVSRGERVSSTRARELGLVNCVYSRHTLDQDARSYAADLAGRSATALALTKGLLYELGDLSFDDGLERGARVNAEARGTEDCRGSAQGAAGRRTEKRVVPFPLLPNNCGTLFSRLRRDPPCANSTHSSSLPCVTSTLLCSCWPAPGAARPA